MTIDKERLSEALRVAVLQKVQASPEVHSHHVAVIVDDDVVTLVGRVESVAEARAAEAAARRVPGVAALVSELTVSPDAMHNDAEIARRVVRVLGCRMKSPERIKVIVRLGHVVMLGNVETPAERAAAEDAARTVAWVKSVSNGLRVLSTAT